MKFLDNVIQDFIDNAPDGMQKAKYSAYRERSVGLGVMGYHSFLQSKMIPMESAMAKSWNLKMFKHINQEVNKASKLIAEEKGACPDAKELGMMERFTHKTAIAPTASISVIAGSTSPGIEPINSNAYTQKSLTGSFNIRNKYLRALLKEKGQDSDDIWSSIMNHEGSISHLDFLTAHEKDVFKTAFEINQEWLIEHAADRTPYICQAQSVNIFIPADIDKSELNKLHYLAWKKGMKSLYYCRSKSLQRADKVSISENIEKHQLEIKLSPVITKGDNEYDECLACQ
jgi:ribonucleoside-diphosphate reductase alpha chain